MEGKKGKNYPLVDTILSVLVYSVYYIGIIIIMYVYIFCSSISCKLFTMYIQSDSSNISERYQEPPFSKHL